MSQSTLDQQNAMLQELAKQKQQLSAQQQLMEQAQAEIHRLTALAAASSNSSNNTTSFPMASSTRNSINIPNKPLTISCGTGVKPLAPSSFSGQIGNSAIQWLAEVERYFSITGTDFDSFHCVLLASTYLRDAASVWFTCSYPTLVDTPHSWKSFKESFLNRFRPLAAEKVARAQLRDLRHLGNVAEYSDAFLTLLQHIPSMHISDQIDTYIHGLKSHIATEVDRLDPQTLSEAMNAAQKVEGRQLCTKEQPLIRTSKLNNYLKFPYDNYNYASDSSFQPTLAGPGTFNSPPTSNPVVDYPNNPPSDSKFISLHSSDSDKMDLSYLQHEPYFPSTHNHSIDSLSQAEYVYCKRHGLCFRCQQYGHRTRECPTRSY